LALDSDLGIFADHITALDCFFQSYTSPVSLGNHPAEPRSPPVDLLKTKLVPAILSASKSTNALTRSSSALLLNTLITPSLVSGQDEELALFLVKEITAPLRAQKTASPDHRIALCHLLRAVITVSPKAPPKALQESVDALAASLAKESNESALRASLQVLSDALAALLRQDYNHLKTAATLLVKGMQDVKANFRRIYTGAAADIIWTHAAEAAEATPVTEDFVKALLSGFEAALKNATTSPVTSSTEGWVAVATLKGPLAAWKLGKDVLDKTSAMHNILSIGAKPSFLLAEKGYRKLSDADDEVWLVRAVESVLGDTDDQHKISDSTGLQSAITAPLLHIALDSAHYTSRKAALQAIVKTNALYTKTPASSLFVDAFVTSLLQAEKHDAMLSSVTEEVHGQDRAPRLQAVATAVARAGTSSDTLLIKLLVPSHHELMSESISPIDCITII
jgi:hypothetical protein